MLEAYELRIQYECFARLDSTANIGAAVVRMPEICTTEARSTNGYALASGLLGRAQSFMLDNYSDQR